MTAFTLRPVTPADQPFLLALFASTRDDLAQLDADAATLQQLLQMQCSAQQRHYARHYPHAQGSLVLAQDGTPIGQLLVERSVRQILLVDISLLPASRRRGIGTQLVRALMEECSLQAIPLRLNVALGNPAARLYGRLGFMAHDLQGMHQCMEWRARQSVAAHS
jgi:ribosomal protein S18 acetylase RimI-like enzyme